MSEQGKLSDIPQWQAKRYQDQNKKLVEALRAVLAVDDEEELRDFLGRDVYDQMAEALKELDQ